MSRPAGDDGLLGALRRATRTAHERLDARLAWSPASSLAAYRRVLEAFLGFYEPLEARLSAAADCFAPLRWQPRRKVHLLCLDLLDLGLTRESIAALPRCEVLPCVSSTPEALGCLYVIEGATLGGRVISRRLRPVGISPAWAGRFFHGYGAETGRMWKQTVDRLGHADDGGALRQRTVTSAVELFAALERWLERQGALR